MEHVHPLRAYRDARGISQQEFANSLGVLRTTVARWEGGTRKISKNKLSEISEKTGIKPAELRPDLAQLFEREVVSA